MDPEAYNIYCCYLGKSDTDEDRCNSGPEKEGNVHPENNKGEVDPMKDRAQVDAIRNEANVEPMHDKLNQINTFVSYTGTAKYIEMRGEFDVDGCQVFSMEEVALHMIDCIQEVISVLQTPVGTTRILLSHFRWDKIELIERFYEGGEDRLFAEARVINPSKELDDTAVRSRDNEQETCGICFTELCSSFLFRMKCNHGFCEDCWCDYFTENIMEKGVAATIACAAHGCDILVGDNSVIGLVRDRKVKRKFQLLVANSFVECNRLLRWCPSPDCKYVIKVRHVESMQRVTCKCGHSFCFSCSKDWHGPIRCSMLEKWIERSLEPGHLEESASLRWVASNTKKCPKCEAAIEKDGGCRFMLCKNSTCRTDFCWVCLEVLDPHDNQLNHVCKPLSYVKVDKSLSREKSESAIKYMFHYESYMTHKKSLELMQEMQLGGKTWSQVEYLKLAVDALCQCRQALMYTYAFVFYLQENNQSIIIRLNQKDLENATETLSGYLEEDVRSPESCNERNIQAKSEYCERRRKVLLEHVYEGYEKEWWEYNSEYSEL